MCSSDLRPTPNTKSNAESTVFFTHYITQQCVLSKKGKVLLHTGVRGSKKKEKSVQAMAIESNPINVVIFENGWFSRLWEIECGKVREKEKRMIITIKEEMTC